MMGLTGPDIARVAALMGDPARANMLSALMSGIALTARELAEEAGVTPQTASSHLAQLRDGGLLTVRKQGRHRYFALADDGVAEVLEGMSGLAGHAPRRRTRPGPRDAHMRTARVCYDHLAGTMGVHLFDSLVTQGALDRSKGLSLTHAGEALMASLGVDVGALQSKRAPLLRECLDWSERRSHLGGSLGRALYARFEALGWVRRESGGRTVRFTPRGLRDFRLAFPLA